MAIKAYVLATTSVGKTGDALKALRASDKVLSADAVTGPYDIIAVVEGADANAIGKLVTQEIHGVAGIERTLTCLALELD